MKNSLLPPIAGFLAAAFIGIAAAQVPPPGRMPHPPIDVAAVLGIDADRAAQVERVLRAGREKMHATFESAGRPTDDASRAARRAAMDAIRSETDQKLAAILSADEISRLHEAMKPRHGRPPNA